MEHGDGTAAALPAPEYKCGEVHAAARVIERVYHMV